MKKIFFCFILLLFSSQSSIAYTHGTPGATGRAQLNLGGVDLIPANIINIFKVSSVTFNTPADASRLDIDGYLTSSPVGNVGISFTTGSWLNVQYKIAWPATVQFKLQFNNILSGCVATNATLAGCAGATTTVTTVPGLAGSVTFTPLTTFSMSWFSGGTFSHTAGEVAIYRVSDEAAYLAGEYFTPEFKALLSGLGTMRPMGWVQAASANFNGETTWANRIRPTSFSWKASNIPPGVWGGTISGTDTYTGSTAPNTPVIWTDGEQYIGVWTNANTSATPTLNIGSRGAKTIVTTAVGTLSAGAIASGTLGTVTYDAILDVLIYNSNGIAASVPIEVQAQLANAVRANLWATVPPMASDDYVTNWATSARDSLSPALYLYPEYSNEIWNFSFPQTQWATARGAAFGFSASSNARTYGYYGLRARQIMGNLIPAVWAGRRVRRVMAYQAAGDSTNVTFRFNGRELAPSGVGTGVGNAAYVAFTSGADYTTFPNRPIDTSEVLSYAPYAGGTNLCLGPDINCTPNASNAPFYQALVTAWEGGDQATSVAMINQDIRSGRTLVQNVTASGTTFTTPLAHGYTTNSTPVVFQVSGGTAYSGVTISTLYRVSSTPTSTTFTIQAYSGGFPAGSNVNAGSAGSGTVTVGASPVKNQVNLASTWYQFGETTAASYDSIRTGGGLAILRIEQYEGALELVGPSAAQCTSLSIVGSDCTGSIAAAILAWKFDPLASATMQAYYNGFMGLDANFPATFGVMPHSRAPAHLVLLSGGVWSLISGALPNSTPYQLYYGFQNFSRQ